MKKREAELKSLFTRRLKQECPDFLNLLQASRGAPDRAIVGNGVTSWLEFKHGDPSFESPGDQELMAMRMAVQGYCRYVVWQSQGGIERTLIVHPRAVHFRTGWTLEPESSCEGFDMPWLVGQIRKVHGR